MIEPKPGSYEKWLPASKSLGGGQENLFFHADVAEKPSSKLSIRSPINLVGMSHSRLKQLFKSPVVCHKKVCDRSCFSVLSWCHPLPPTMSSSETGKGSREKFDTIDISARGRGAQQRLPNIFFLPRSEMLSELIYLKTLHPLQ
jgi:hypothetical protein